VSELGKEGQKDRSVTGVNDRIFDMLVYIAMVFVLIVVVYPLLYVVSCSLSNPARILTNDIILFPKELTFDSYTSVIKENRLGRGYLNTIVYTVLGTVINLALTATGAYALSCKKMKGRKFFTKMILFTMLFSGGLIPTYLVVNNLKLLNTMWSIILPNAIGVTNFIIMKNSFENSIPDELKEAASVEGCSDIGIFWRIVLPLSKPILAVMVIFYGVGHWNEYFNALLYITDRTKQPLQVVLRDILISNELTEMMGNVSQLDSQSRLAAAEGMRYSTIVVSSLPVILLYPFFQKYFVKGVMVGAVKG